MYYTYIGKCVLGVMEFTYINHTFKYCVLGALMECRWMNVNSYNGICIYVYIYIYIYIYGCLYVLYIYNMYVYV